MPESAPVAASKVIPPGRASPPSSVSSGVGNPPAVTLTMPGDPTTKLVLESEVIAGASFTVRVKCWMKSMPMPLRATMS